MKARPYLQDSNFSALDRLNIAIQEARSLRTEYERKLEEVRAIAIKLPGLELTAADRKQAPISPPPISSAKGKAPAEGGRRPRTMSEEHKRKIAEGRRRYFQEKRAAAAGNAEEGSAAVGSDAPATLRAGGADEAMIRRRAADEDIMPINPMRHAVSDNTPTLATAFDSEPEDGEGEDGSGAEAAEREGRQSRRKFRGGPVRRGRRVAGAA